MPFNSPSFLMVWRCCSVTVWPHVDNGSNIPVSNNIISTLFMLPFTFISYSITLPVDRLIVIDQTILPRDQEFGN